MMYRQILLRTFVGSFFAIPIVLVLVTIVPHRRHQRLVRLLQTKGADTFMSDVGPTWIPSAIRSTFPYWNRATSVRFNHGGRNPKEACCPEVFYGISSMKTINDISIFNMELTHQHLRSLEGLQNVKKIRLVGTTVKGRCLDSIAKMSGIRTLILEQNMLDSESLEPIRQMVNLEELDLCWGTDVADQDLRHMASLKSLRRLRLHCCEVTDVGLQQLRNLNRLEVLSLQNTCVTGKGIEFLAVMSNLRELRLDETGMTQEDRESLRRSLPNCKISPDP